MCLPCFPWTWTKCEDPYDNLHKAPKQSVWVHDGQNWELQRVVSILISLHFILILSIASSWPFALSNPFQSCGPLGPEPASGSASDNRLESKATTKRAIEGYQNINKPNSTR